MGTKISEFPQQISLSNTDLIPVVSEGVTSKISYQTVVASMNDELGIEEMQQEIDDSKYTLTMDSDNLTLAPQSGEESNVPLATLADGLIKTRTLTSNPVTIVGGDSTSIASVNIPCYLAGYTPIAVTTMGTAEGGSWVCFYNSYIANPSSSNASVTVGLRSYNQYPGTSITVSIRVTVIYVKS